jgi:hypothetical protein
MSEPVVELVPIVYVGSSPARVPAHVWEDLKGPAPEDITHVDWQPGEVKDVPRGAVEWLCQSEFFKLAAESQNEGNAFQKTDEVEHDGGDLGPDATPVVVEPSTGDTPPAEDVTTPVSVEPSTVPPADNPPFAADPVTE